MSSSNPTLNEKQRSPWWWVPSVYLAEGIPYVVVNTISVVMYTKLGVTPRQMALFTSLLAFPWVVKPLWGPLVDLYWTKRKWILLMQLLLAGVFGITAFLLQTNIWWSGTLIALSAAALLSATHDIAIDGFYMVGLDKHTQALFVGIRATFYRIAMILGQGVLIMIVGMFEMHTGPTPVGLALQVYPKGASAPAVQAPAQDPDAFARFDPPTLALAAGTTAPVQITLARAPETTAVVSISAKPSSLIGYFFKVGPEYVVSVKGGDRIEIGPDNWQVSRSVVVSADPRVKEPVTATWQATAGNIPLTWTWCFAGISIFFFMLLMLHTGVLPKTSADHPTAVGSRPPFIIALGAILPVVVVPVGAFLVLFYGFTVPWTDYKIYGIRPLIVKLAPDLHKDLQSFLAAAIIVAIGWIFLAQRSGRHMLGNAFRWMARKSGVPFDDVFISFFQKPYVARMIIFLLVYRLGEAMLVKMAAPFLIGPKETGAMGLSAADYGLAYGTVGVLSMTVAGILGGLVAARHGLKKWLLPMFLILNIPHLSYLVLAYFRPENFFVIVGCVAIEAFGYGFGFAAYMLYMIYVAGQGEHRTSHFAICTGFMALGMMLPGMISGAVQEATSKLDASTFGSPGWVWFFIVVLIAMLPGLLMVHLIPLDPEFGKKTDK